jgi:hypothetical protein
MNWTAKPLVSVQFIVDMIAATTTKKGLIVKSKVDMSLYKKGQKISDEELSAMKITKIAFHGEWNYKISPLIV